MESLLNRLIPDKLHRLVLIMLFIIGSVLRLIKIPSGWDGDFAQFYLTAYHIVKYGEYPVVGQFASAINFYYPPFAYYFLAFLMLFNSSLEFVISFFAICHSLSILTVYALGRNLFDSPKTGLLSAFFFTFASTEIFYSRSLMGNSIVIPFMLLSLLFFTLYLKNSNKRHLIISYSLIFLSGLFNYAHFPFLLVYSIYTYFKTKRLFKIIFFNLLFIASFVLFNFPLLIVLKKNSLFLPSYQGINPEKLVQDLFLYFQSVFIFNPANIFKGYILVIVLTFINIFYKNYRFRPVLLLASLISATYLSLFFVCRECFPAYYTSVYPFFYLILSFLIINLINIKKKSARAVAYFSLIFSMFIFTNDIKSMYYFDRTYPDMEVIAEQIKADVIKYDRRNFNALVIFKKDYWHSPTIWYFLEKKMNIKLTRVAITPLGLEMSNQPANLYIICIDEDKDCLGYIKTNYGHFSLKYQLSAELPYRVYLLEKE